MFKIISMILTALFKKTGLITDFSNRRYDIRLVISVGLNLLLAFVIFLLLWRFYTVFETCFSQAP
jgi:hypothetical protein